MSVGSCMWLAALLRGQERALDTLKLELQEVVGHPPRVIETELPSSVRALPTLNHWAFSLVPGLPVSHACLCVSYLTLLSLKGRVKAGTMPFFLFHSGMESFSRAVKFLAPWCSYSAKHFSVLNMCLTTWVSHREYHNTENPTRNCFLTLKGGHKL